MAPPHRRRYLVELQGYCNLSDPAVADMDVWLRVAPAVCAAWALAATSGGSTAGVALLAAFALAGTVLPWHPFDLPYNLLIRRWTATAPIPRSSLPRRFACSVATLWLTATAAATAAGAPRLAGVLGLAFVGVALVPVTTGLCVPSWLLRRFGPARLRPDDAKAARLATPLAPGRRDSSGLQAR